MNGPQLKQGSEAWHRWRQSGVCASEAPVIMGDSPWMDILTLYRIKIGELPEPDMNEYMKRGLMLEPLARRAYEERTGNIVEPCLVEHPEIPWMRASLDGATFDGDLIVEIKNPGHSIHNEALEGRVPDHYWAQVQHQLMTCQNRPQHDYWSYNPSILDERRGALVPVEPDLEYQARLFEAERAFWECVQRRTPPVQPEYSGTATITDTAALNAAAQYACLKLEIAAAEKKAKEYLKTLTAACTAKENWIGAVRISRCKGRATLDAKAAEKAGVDLGPYRKSGMDYWRTEIKGLADKAE